MPSSRDMNSTPPTLRLLSHMNEDGTVNHGIVMEEIECMIHRLKKGKAAGKDGICSEHVLYGGEILKVWLKLIFNSILHQESIPSCFR